MVMSGEPDWQRALRRARDHAPFLSRALDRQPELEGLLADGEAEAALTWAKYRGEHEDIAVALRRHRLALATSLAIGDLAGAFPLSLVLKELSDFADYALDTAIRTAIAERTGEDSRDGMIALALGKQGAGELNYSSDIDPILIFDRDRLPCRSGDDPGETAQRYAKRVVKLLSDTTPEGYVLRVDLRLRPASEISPPAVPLGSALAHYQGQALPWERAAFIRARAAAGDIPAGEHFLEQIAPFIWREALDFGAIEEIRALTLQIRQSHDGPQVPGPGFDVKRGRGGIREIEFFAQTHQLIHGCRDASLRVRGTRSALNALAAAGRIDAEQAQVLGECYDRLRMIEHRLQMVNDRQTHSLPEGQLLDSVAQLDGLADGAALVYELADLTSRSGQIYEELIGPQPRPAEPIAVEPSELVLHLKSLGYQQPEALADRIENWRSGTIPALRSGSALEAFDALLPTLLKAIGESDDPDRAMTRWQTILERIPSALTLFRLLKAQPIVLKRFVSALTLSPTLADQLARRPDRLDVLIDNTPLALTLSATEIAARMRERTARNDYEAQLDAIRRETGEARFLLGLRLIEADNTPREIAHILSNFAEAAIQVATEAATAQFALQHGHVPEAELLVLGLGRLGGGALTHASDLDLVYLFTGPFDAQSDGPRPLGATLYFNRLASRVTAALSAPTAQGALYEVDTRLRPQGNQGPLAVSLDAFGKYQRETAWTWEHMALARARVLVGSKTARGQVRRIIDNVLRQKRDPHQLRSAVLDMRGEMAQHKQARGPIDVKLLRGGLVDIEFLTHFLQLRDANILTETTPDAMSPSLSVALTGLARRGLVDAAIVDAHRLMTDLLVASRLLAPDGNRPPSAAASALARACGRENYAELVKDLAVSRTCVATAWGDIFDQSLEIDYE